MPYYNFQIYLILNKIFFHIVLRRITLYTTYIKTKSIFIKNPFTLYDVFSIVLYGEISRMWMGH